ncbi:MAG: lytic transglycosylase domain-containing protein [Candidatus Moranbacteria bacterium]|nr:lytic transglycosylase domain-containing protein [Candidatus Moranbacteria bacterium]
MKRRYVLATLTLLASLSTTNAYCQKAKKGHASDEETSAAPMTSETGTGTDAGKGADHLHRISAEASNSLRQRGVMSRAFPNRSVSDVIPRDILSAIPVIEHVDGSKIRNEGSWAAIRDVLSVIGKKGRGSYAATRSQAGAHGLFQYMPGTYAGIRRMYPEARLISSFSEGMKNEVNAAMAAYLLLDESLSGVDKGQRDALMRSPETLRRFLATAYNAGGRKAVSALESGSRNRPRLELSHRNLPRETQAYLRKLAAYRMVAAG